MTKYKLKWHRVAEAALAVAKYSTEGSIAEAGLITQFAAELMEQFGLNEDIAFAAAEILALVARSRYSALLSGTA